MRENEPSGEPKIALGLSEALDLIAVLETLEIVLQIMPPQLALGFRNQLSDQVHRCHVVVASAVILQVAGPPPFGPHEDRDPSLLAKGDPRR
jgi:hypothetical protein